MIIAGTATAGARITIFVDRTQQASTIAEYSGAFVSLLSVEPSNTARVLSMIAELDGMERASDDQIILAPTPALVVAALEPEQSTEPAALATGSKETLSQDTPQAPVEMAQADTAPAKPATDTAASEQVDTAEVAQAETTPATDTATSEQGDASDLAQAETTPAATPTTDTAIPEQVDGVNVAQAETTPATPTADTATSEQGDAVEVAHADTVPTTDTATPEQVDAVEVADADTAPTTPTTDTATPEQVDAVEVVQADTAPTTRTTDSVKPEQSDAAEAAQDTARATPASDTAKPEPDAAVEVAQADTATPTIEQNDEGAAPAQEDVAAASPVEQTAGVTDAQVATKPTDAVDPVDTANAATLGQPSQGGQPGETTAALAPLQAVPATGAEVAAIAPTPQGPTPQAQPQAQSQAPRQVTVLRAGPDGVEVLQSGSPVPEVMDRIALDTISYSEAGEIQLAGRAQTDTTVRVYLDNKPVGDLVTDKGGRWSGEVAGITPGIYTLRLDELGEDGQVLSRIETPFKRESPEALRPPQDPNALAQGDTSDGSPVPQIRAVTVQRGDTLWAISRERYGDGVLYVRVFEANRGDIRNPDLIYPGQVFNLPE